jgi:alpha-D-xyloside xylohydrolase
MPLFVRAGSIIPMGPFIQYSTEKNDPIEIRIYPGANGEFTLYEDENDNYGYLSGLYSLTTFRWNDEQKMLTINARKGSYPGMPKAHTFNVVLAGENKGVGVEVSTMIDKAIRYSGKEVIIRF